MIMTSPLGDHLRPSRKCPARRHRRSLPLSSTTLDAPKEADERLLGGRRLGQEAHAVA